ncbi:MAG: phospholipid carrier-dependent glycosyltransferase [Blastochloris sp.]|nr:phospholipid carrier-dependent glycosyltransferase [Blastochloris sp.]
MELYTHTPEAMVPRAVHGRASSWLIAGIVAMIALLPRVIGNADFYTIDEAYHWEGRVARFAAALSQTDWAATNQTGHPGVTTMWLGALGREIALQVGIPAPDPGQGALYLSYLRLPVAVVNGLAVGIGYLLLRRLVRPPVACLAALMWALSPFLIAHGRLLHLDGLLTSFCTLSLLALLAATHPSGKMGGMGFGSLALLVASGAFAGLALLTKSPALILPPLAGLILLVAALAPVLRQGASAGKVGAALRMSARASIRWVIWGVTALLIFVLLWPALWVDPGGAIGSLLKEVTGNAAQPHGSGNFFFGRPVDDPGWGFYPSVVLWRGEMLVLAGIGALLVLAGLDLASIAFRASAAGSDDRRPTTDDGRAGCAVETQRELPAQSTRRGANRQAGHLIRATSPSERWAAGWLVFYVLLFVIAVTLMPKKFDRYLLPIWPSLAVLAAIGFGALVSGWGNSKARITRAARSLGSLGAALGGIALSVGPLVAAHPYYLASYNPMLGGGVLRRAYC